MPAHNQRLIDLAAATCHPSTTLHRLRCCVLSGTVLAGVLLPTVASGQTSGGNWIPNIGGNCNIDNTSTNSYVGVCKRGAGEDASGANVTFNDTAHRYVLGGYSIQGNATNNTVTIAGGTINESVSGGYSIQGNAAGNGVTITGGVIDKWVFGGYSIQGNATGNTVTVAGGTINDDVYGGYSGISGGATTHNHILLEGSPQFGPNTILYGGNRANTTGNILEVRTKGLTAHNIKNFEQYRFLLPATTQAGDTILTLTDGAGTNISHGQVGVAMQAGGKLLQPGDQVTLIHNDNGVTTTDIEQIQLTSYHGISLEYDLGLSSDAHNLYAVTESAPRVRAQTKAPLEGRMGAVALTLQGADLIASAGMQDVASGSDGAFGMIVGGKSRYASGSHVDVNGVNLLLGLKKHFAMGASKVAAGVFLEGGWGRHHTYNDFDGHTVRGSGKSDYIGVGLMARQQWESGVYAEASVRGGRVKSDWSSGDMGIPDAAYKTSAPYLGAHIGLGYVWPISQRTSLDLSAKYLWAHQGSDRVDIGGDPYYFKKTESQRTRLGARLNVAVNDSITAYAGAAWEREYDNRARATVYGLSTPSPSLKGNTGIFEVGLRTTPDAKSPLTLSLGVQGYAGKREGLSASLQTAWAF